MAAQNTLSRAEHYDRAEQILEGAALMVRGSLEHTAALQAAQVHATLASCSAQTEDDAAGYAVHRARKAALDV